MTKETLYFNIRTSSSENGATTKATLRRLLDLWSEVSSDWHLNYIISNDQILNDIIN